MAQFNKNQPWARGQAPPGAADMPGLMGAFGAAGGPPVFQAQGGMPPGLALGPPAGHNPAVTLGAMAASQQVSLKSTTKPL